MTRKNKIVLVMMLLIGVIITYFSLRSISLKALVSDLIKLKWGWLIVALISMLASFMMEAVVVKMLLHRETMNFPWLDAIRVPLIEQLFNGITPFSSGGQPAQLFALVQSGVDAGRATSVLLMKFVVYQSMIVINLFLLYSLAFITLLIKCMLYHFCFCSDF